MYKTLLKPILFKFDPENVHDRFTSVGKFLGALPPARFLTRKLLRYDNSVLEQEIAGINFKNPIGLSAGFDKDANLIKITESVGFGFQQVGSVTLKSYVGNPGKRLHRLPKSQGIVVYYGLKNDGTAEIVKRLEGAEGVIKDYPLSISVAKTNSKEAASEQEAIQDYIGSLKLLEEINVQKFYTINISCPNTYGGEPFTTPEKFGRLAKEIKNLKLSKPVFVKLPINLPWSELRGLIQVAVENNFAGIIIGNLNKDRDREEIKDEIPEEIKGGISGLPTKMLSDDLIANSYKEFGDKLVVIGVGGVFSAEDAYAKIRKGASLVQLITGMIYEGPQLIGKINKGLVKLLEKDGFSNISEAVGADFRENN